MARCPAGRCGLAVLWVRFAYCLNSSFNCTFLDWFVCPAVVYLLGRAGLCCWVCFLVCGSVIGLYMDKVYI